MKLYINKEKIKDVFKRGGVVLASSLMLLGIFPPTEVEAKTSEPSSLVAEALNSNGTSAEFFNEPITNKDISKLPYTLESLRLTDCMFVTDLSILPIVCPNLKVLKLNCCSGIIDLSFLYQFPNLEEVYLNDMAGTTFDLINDLTNRGIDVKVESDDIIASEKVDEILSEIITDDMTDDEKMRSIIIYISKMCKYNIFKMFSSNSDPLETTIISKKGVCAGIAYTTNVMFRKAGIESYEVMSKIHGWNLVKTDGKYYYIDVTNLGDGIVPKALARTILKNTKIEGLGYKMDPKATFLTVTKKYDAKTLKIPVELVEDIKAGQDIKTLSEKYKNCVSIRLLIFLLIFLGITNGPTLFKKIKEEIEYRL